MASSTSFRAQAARFRLSTNSGHIAALHRSATKSADARRGVAVGGQLRQAAGAAAPVAADKRNVTRLQPQTLQCTICREGQKPKFIQGSALARPPVIRLLLAIQVPHASDKGSVALLSCPIDGFLEGGEDVVCVVFCGNRHMRVMFEPPPPTRTASAQGHVMDKSDVAEALHEYEEAMTEFLTSVRARDTLADFPLRQRLYAAGIQIERLKLRGTPAYNDAVLRADLNSWPR